MLVASVDMQNADLLMMGPQLQPERVIPLAPKQDPNAIALFQQHMLLTDMSNFLVRRLDLHGRVLGPFGDATFQTELTAARNQAQWSRRMPTRSRKSSARSIPHRPAGRGCSASASSCGR